MSQKSNTSDSTAAENRSLDAIATKDRWMMFADRVRAVSEECILTVDSEGIHTLVQDPSKVLMVDLSLAPGGFESYESTGDEIGLNLARFTDVLGLAEKTDLVRVALDTETRMFHVAGDGFEYKLAGLDPDSVRNRPDIPELDLAVCVSISGDKFARAIDGADMISDHIYLGNDSEGECFYAGSEGDIDDVRFEWGHDDLASVEQGVGEDVESFYSTNYLDEATGALSDDAVTVHVDEEFPLVFTQPFAEGAGDCLFMLAPRIRNP